MKRTIKRTFLGLAILAGTIMVSYVIFKTNTKSFSPEETVTFPAEELTLEVFYNRPYKKDREIFGGLVPYDEVWRTGANEATTFFTDKDILVDGSLLAAGTYTLWTIPKEDSWKIIFNSKLYPWGITPDGEPSREAAFDVLTIEVPVIKLEQPIEQFTIDFKNTHDFILMTMAWDQTMVEIPIKDLSKVDKMS